MGIEFVEHSLTKKTSGHLGPKAHHDHASAPLQHVSLLRFSAFGVNGARTPSDVVSAGQSQQRLHIDSMRHFGNALSSHNRLFK